MTVFTRLKRFARDARGAMLIEFGFALPVLILLGLGFAELVHLAMTNTRVNQIAISVADNASRAKQASASGAPRMREYDVDEAFQGAELQFSNVDVTGRGRVILSSLEVNPDGGQWIHWQRCFGSKSSYSSKYGVQGTGATGTALLGMGPADRIVAAESNAAIMFVEVYFDYKPLFFGFGLNNHKIYKSAAMYVRDDRDLSQIYNPAPTSVIHNC